MAPTRIAICLATLLASPLMARAALPSPAAPMAATTPAVATDEWLTIHGFPSQEDSDVIQVNPTSAAWSTQITLEVRVSRKQMRTSFKGHRYRSYTALTAFDCGAKKGWYLSNQYYQEPLWRGPITGREEFQQGEAPVAFKDVPGDTAAKLVTAACRPRP